MSLLGLSSDRRRRIPRRRGSRNLSVNLHIGFNVKERDKAEKDYKRRTKTALAQRTNRLSFVKLMAMASSSVVEATADLILHGTFDRFPRLKVMSEESGFGYVPCTARPRPQASRGRR